MKSMLRLYIAGAVLRSAL